MPQENGNSGGPASDGGAGPPRLIQAASLVKAAFQKGIEQDDLTGVEVPVLVTFLVMQLVSKPAQVGLYVTKAVRSTTLEFDVADEDVGKIIGKGGHTIDSIRSLARSISGASGEHYEIKIIEDNGVGGMESRGRQDSGRTYRRRFSY